MRSFRTAYRRATKVGKHCLERKPPTVTKAESVSRIAKHAGIFQKTVDSVLISVVRAIHESLEHTDGKIRIPDLGTFELSHQETGTGVIPRTGRKIEIPGKQTHGFIAEGTLKEAENV